MLHCTHRMLPAMLIELLFRLAREAALRAGVGPLATVVHQVLFYLRFLTFKKNNNGSRSWKLCDILRSAKILRMGYVSMNVHMNVIFVDF